MHTKQGNPVLGTVDPVLVLSFHTATPRAGLALLYRDIVLEESYWLAGEAQGIKVPYANRLAVETERMIQIHQVSWDHVSVLGVTMGPGSFTGIRSALSFVKGLAFARNLPVAAIGTLEGLAWQAGNGLICPLVDARRGEFYWGLYQVDDGTLTEIIAPRVSTAEILHIELSAYGSMLDKFPIVFSGEPLYEAAKLPEWLRDTHKTPPSTWTLRPSAVGQLAWLKYRMGQLTTAAQLLPVYLRAPI
ncbi:MAG: tRNA (adenosine(37)-N6)-threonylcarbamoyltransferase complex dimerization subunit type 1 TsaB [Coprothermobacterota bacterium]|nr:tRNA (adenosine(37)-N6)-threonylcarbamoyltransferase complex dimerization subunit type 1 TsaB [Coprothermobacterota bacterium]